jgi:hypothetical protein
MPKKISGVVAQIVSDREVILNRGSLDGVKVGEYYKVLDPKTIGVTDPESGKVIGSIVRIKIVLEAVDVAERLTIARTFRSKEINVGGAGVNVLGGLLSPPKYVEKVETLRRGADQPAPIGERESIVAIGDPFESASADEKDTARSVSLWREANPGESL